MGAASRAVSIISPAVVIAMALLTRMPVVRQYRRPRSGLLVDSYSINNPAAPGVWLDLSAAVFESRQTQSWRARQVSQRAVGRPCLATCKEVPTRRV